MRYIEPISTSPWAFWWWLFLIALYQRYTATEGSFLLKGLLGGISIGTFLTLFWEGSMNPFRTWATHQEQPTTGRNNPTKTDSE
jgi:hypothetical protein